MSGEKTGKPEQGHIVDIILGGGLLNSLSTVRCNSLREDDRAIFQCKIDIWSGTDIGKHCALPVYTSL